MKTRAALLMLLPAIGAYALTFVAPMIVVGRLSLFQSDYVREVWVGMGNYAHAMEDRYFRRSFVNGFVFVGMIAPLLITTAYAIASFLSTFHERVQAVARFVLYVPSLAGGVIMTLLWRWILHREGLVNGFLALASIPAVPWLTEIWPARLSIALISLAGSVGGTVILFAASMHAISPELREAALIDGADDRAYRKHIVRPLMVPTIVLCLILNVVGIMQMWETPYVLFEGGGPEGSTSSPVYEIFMTAFMFGRQGLAAAKGVILMAVIASLLAIKQRVERWAR